MAPGTPSGDSDAESGVTSSADTDDGPTSRLMGGADSGSEEEPGCCSEAQSGYTWKQCLLLYAFDIPASVVFWYFFLFWEVPSDFNWNAFYGVFIALLVAWRLWLLYSRRGSQTDGLPYTCGWIQAGGKELLIIATVHISHKSPQDVRDVVEARHPNIVMIELDEERLGRMKAAPSPSEEKNKDAHLEDLQAITISGMGAQPETLYAQRAVWNAEREGEVIGPSEIFFDDENPHGTEDPSEMVEDRFCLVRRGAPDDSGSNSTFAQKSFHLNRSGAKGILVINKEADKSQLPPYRLGVNSPISHDMKLSLKYCSCGMPPIPVFLLSNKDGERIREALGRNNGHQPVRAELQIRDDDFPRRTLRKRLCHTCALVFSGIGILYGVIQCFAVEVGEEFFAAEEAATKANVPCVCVDSNMNNFWGTLGAAVVPTPCNIYKSLSAWLGFPRVLARFFFPRSDNVDCFGSIFLHAWSFPLKTWVAFLLAGFCASQVTNFIMESFTDGAAKAAESAGVVKKKDHQDLQVLLMLALEFYLFPRIYEGVAASRDEVMYRMTRRRVREYGSRCSVLVVGAGHANGILQRIRACGL